MSDEIKSDLSRAIAQLRLGWKADKLLQVLAVAGYELHRPDPLREAEQALKHRQRPNNNLQMLREKHGLTQFALANLIGCHGVTIAKWERGFVSPRPARLLQLARALNCTPADIYPPAPSK